MRSTYGRAIVLLTVLSAVLAPFVYPVRSFFETPASTAQTDTTRITVTTSSDAANGDTSSIQRLRSSPGADGISLREAILATNNKPGRYAIRFAHSLKGATIRVGSATGIDLPTLTGGGVSIEGDIDGDGRPDVTLRGGFQRPYPAHCLQGEHLCPAFRISSGRNELRSLNLRVFVIGVLFTPSPASDPLPNDPPFDTRQTYSNNVVTGLVMSDIVQKGIHLTWHHCVPPCPTHNRWINTTLSDNTIHTRAYGISFKLTGSIGDRFERFTIVNNTIRIARSSAGERIGIAFESGPGVGNRISDGTIAGNSVRGDLHRGIRLASGVLGGDANTIERVRITDNLVIRSPHVQVRDRDPEGSWCGHCFGIELFLSEGSALYDRDLRPIQYADGNQIRDVEIARNTIEGPWRRGVAILNACCGGSRNSVENIRIRSNTIRLEGFVEGVHIDAGECYVPTCIAWKKRPTSGNQVSEVSIDGNDISIEGEGSSPEHDLEKGGIILVGGKFKSRAGRITGVSITNNRIDTELIGISVLGGSGGENNVVFDVRIEGNQILREPVPIRYVLSDVKGITVTGGFGGATGNQVACVAISENGVAGVPNDVSVVQNAEVESEYTSSRNSATIDLLTLEEAIAQAPNVFIGTVTSTANSGQGPTIAVEETWRSEYLTRPAGIGLPETVEVRVTPRDAPCPFMPTAAGDRRLEVGERYLFIPYERSDSVFWDDGWTWTTRFEPALERFRPPRLPDLIDATPEATAAPSEDTSDGRPGLGFVIAAALAAVAALALLFRRMSRR